jgi:hypothetical protein
MKLTIKGQVQSHYVTDNGRCYTVITDQEVGGQTVKVFSDDVRLDDIPVMVPVQLELECHGRTYDKNQSICVTGIKPTILPPDAFYSDELKAQLKAQGSK